MTTFCTFATISLMLTVLIFHKALSLAFFLFSPYFLSSLQPISLKQHKGIQNHSVCTDLAVMCVFDIDFFVLPFTCCRLQQYYRLVPCNKERHLFWILYIFFLLLLSPTIGKKREKKNQWAPVYPLTYDLKLEIVRYCWERWSNSPTITGALLEARELCRRSSLWGQRISALARIKWVFCHRNNEGHGWAWMSRRRFQTQHNFRICIEKEKISL